MANTDCYAGHNDHGAAGATPYTDAELPDKEVSAWWSATRAWQEARAPMTGTAAERAWLRSTLHDSADSESAYWRRLHDDRVARGLSLLWAVSAQPGAPLGAERAPRMDTDGITITDARCTL